MAESNVLPEEITIEPWPAGGWKVTCTVVHDDKLTTAESFVLRHPDSLEKLQDAVNLAMVSVRPA